MDSVKTESSAAEDLRRAVALVHVEVDHGNTHARARRRRVGLDHARGDRGVVEDAIPRAARARCVMSAAGEVRGHAFAERDTRGGDRRAGRAPRALDHRLAPRKSDCTDLHRIEAAGGDALDVARVVRERELAIGRRNGLGKHHLRQLLLDPMAQARVLLHREAMVLGQREHEAVAVEGFQGWGGGMDGGGEPGL